MSAQCLTVLNKFFYVHLLLLCHQSRFDVTRESLKLLQSWALSELGEDPFSVCICKSWFSIKWKYRNSKVCRLLPTIRCPAEMYCLEYWNYRSGYCTRDPLIILFVFFSSPPFHHFLLLFVTWTEYEGCIFHNIYYVLLVRWCNQITVSLK